MRALVGRHAQPSDLQVCPNSGRISDSRHSNARYYIDGGVWSGTNADIAAESDVLLVIEPLAHQTPGEHLRAELGEVAADTVIRLRPDAGTIDLFNAFATNPDVLACRPDAFRAGVRQAGFLAGQLANSGWL
jgi:NTE family protein